MLDLIKNEFIKIFKRKNIYILLIISIIVIIGFNLFEKSLNKKIDISSQYISSYNSDKVSLDNYEYLNIDEEYSSILERVKLEEYAINNKIDYNILLNSENDNISMPSDARILLMKFFDNFDIILIIVIIYLSTTIISEEFSTGTIKNLLTKPYTRMKIISAKILVILLICVILVVFFLAIQYITGGIIFGFDSYNLKYIGYNSNEIFSMNLFVYNFCVGIAKLPMYLISCLICICLGVINCNSAMTMTLTLIVFILGNSVLSLWSEFEKVSNIFKYFITNNWDFSEYLFGGISSIDGINLKFSIIIYFLYFIILSIVAFKIFEKKEIKNI